MGNIVINNRRKRLRCHVVAQLDPWILKDITVYEPRITPCVQKYLQIGSKVKFKIYYNNEDINLYNIVSGYAYIYEININLNDVTYCDESIYNIKPTRYKVVTMKRKKKCES